ncbi:MAG TPA: hypothetical protein VGX76_06260 [Pirellulales bacterium]|nr:hypothetical protein [Pirellulales bacterium]
MHSAYELGKSLSRISLGQWEARNASGYLSETNVNSVILDGHDRQVHKLMWEVERRQPEYREHFIYTTQQPYRVSTTKGKGGRQSKDVVVCFKYAVRHAADLGRYVIDHYQP